MLTWEKSIVILEGWQFKILQQAVKDGYISKFRAAELLFLKKLLSDNGF